ncbi:ABC transporter ATP-binding protein [Alteribacter natronophilus]|uniref:ABC transporter ATP-binding protein n=1 Tax=Alteribacter natronophilus TaxID=2583810 RepID=UPI00110E49EB|nr:ABC transporter ATP-binding protein [Alteribacter natronophilus]TMW71436.1 ABC transporter ATP-binding protein [Alteribacter natronophilus]
MNIKADRISVTYKNTTALHDLSFTLEPGKTYGLVGRNGAGKTTLLSLLASFRKTDSGRLEIDGENPFENARLMSEIAFIYETDYSDEHEPVSSYFDFTARYRKNFDRAYAEKLAKKFSLGLDQPVHKLSKGMQSALNVIIGLAGRTEITIFDEAYSGMDAPAREIFYREIINEKEKHPRTMILSTHLVSEMDYLFDEVIIIHKGQLLLQKTADELNEQGLTVTGNIEDVDRFTEGLSVLGSETLGGTKRAKIYGSLSQDHLEQAAASGLEIGTLPLQDLFISLTEEEHGHEDS